MSDLKEKAYKAIEYIKTEGADKGQVFVSETEKREFNAENGEFSLLRTLFDQKISVTVYKDQKNGSYSANKTEDQDIQNAVRTALAAAEAGEADEAFEVAPYQGELNANQGVSEPDMELLFDRIKELMEDAKKQYPKISFVLLIASYDRRHTVYTNTNNTFCEEYKGSYDVSLEFSAHDGDKTTSLFYTGFCTVDLSRPFIELPQVVRLFKAAQKHLDAKPMEGKFEGTMVLTPGCLNSFMYYIKGLVEGGAILEKTSVWLDKLGEQVADKRITVTMDPTDERVVCGGIITSDGFKSEPYDFIKNGVLKSFILNYYLSRKTGYERAKNYGGNFIVAPGEKSIDEIIKGIDRGILVGEFSGGMPGVNGEFSGVAKNSFYIENGCVKEALSETMINGNLADMLMHLADISSETECDGDSVLPYMAFNNIVVSGK